nr:photosystem II protein Y [Cavernulicola chilensis]
MDVRVLIVLIPVLAAASWALYNIGRAALQQLGRLLSNRG